MSQGAGEGLGSGLLEELVRAFGRDRVLTDPEDLYVYSHYGGFATRRLRNPIAVLRLNSESERKELVKLAETRGIRILRNDSIGLEVSTEDNSSPLVIIDARMPMGADSLPWRLTELEKAMVEGKRARRGSLSFLHWLTASLKTGDGYQIHTQPDCDNGFCVIQPFFDSVETFSSKGRLLLCKGLSRGEIAPTARLVDSLFSCTACGQCYDQLTQTDLEINNAIVRTRNEIVKSGMGPKQCRALYDNIEGEGNPMGMPAEDRALWFEELRDERPFAGNEVLYWAGCSTAYRLPGVVEATANVLTGADVDFGIIGEGEGCCGLILYLIGFWDEARNNAYRIIEKLRNLDVRLLATSCAGCYYAFSRVYPILGVHPPFNVVHTSQLIEALVLNDRLRPGKMRGRYIWHDPCDLGRHCGVYEPPRNVLKSIAGFELVELPLSRRHTLCCGAGGGLWMYNASLAERIAHSKVSGELSAPDIDGVVTGCPACILNLRFAALSLQKNMNIYDLSEIVEKSL